MGRDGEELRDDVRVEFIAFNECARLIHCLKMHKRLFGVEAKKVGGGESSPDEADGNPAHLLRHSHGKHGSAGGQNRAENTAGACLKRKHAHRIVLPRGTAPLS